MDIFNKKSTLKEYIKINKIEVDNNTLKFKIPDKQIHSIKIYFNELHSIPFNIYIKLEDIVIFYDNHPECKEGNYDIVYLNNFHVNLGDRFDYEIEIDKRYRIDYDLIKIYYQCI